MVVLNIRVGPGLDELVIESGDRILPRLIEGDDPIIAFRKNADSVIERNGSNVNGSVKPTKALQRTRLLLHRPGVSLLFIGCTLIA